MPRPRDYSATERVYDAIVSFTANNPYPPSQSEIAAMVGKSRTAVVKHLVHLVEAGRIEIPPGRHRGIRVVS